MKTSRSSPICACLVLAGFPLAIAAADPATGIYSDKADGFKTITLMVHDSRKAYLHASVVGLIGDWNFDEATSMLTFTSFDETSASDLNVTFKFDPKQTTYTMVRPPDKGETGPADILRLVEKEIPMEMVQSFKVWPTEQVKKLREEAVARKKWDEWRAEEIEKQKPEYERTLAGFRKDPKTAINPEYYDPGVNPGPPGPRALMDALADDAMAFPEDVLVAILEQLPEDNHWIPQLIFRRGELSGTTLRKYLPVARRLAEKWDPFVLGNFASNPNLPPDLAKEIEREGGNLLSSTAPPAPERRPPVEGKETAPEK